jgi:hypothetical protein
MLPYAALRDLHHGPPSLGARYQVEKHEDCTSAAFADPDSKMNRQVDGLVEILLQVIEVGVSFSWARIAGAFVLPCRTCGILPGKE